VWYGFVGGTQRLVATFAGADGRPDGLAAKIAAALDGLPAPSAACARAPPPATA
jgi:hypothetical protein